MGCPIIEGVLYIRNNSTNEKLPATPGNTFFCLRQRLYTPHEKGTNGAMQQQGRAAFQKKLPSLVPYLRTLGKSLVSFMTKKAKNNMCLL